MEQANTIEDYLKKIARYNIYEDVFYRGQLEKYKNITSSISRDKNYTLYESNIYSEAINMKSAEFTGLSTPIEYLSKMQHYGIPTRLIDLTVDPLIALFFAVQNIDDESHGNIHIFVPSEQLLNDKRIKLLSLIATLESLEIDVIKNSFHKCYSESITENEILKFASEGAFVKNSLDLQKTNERLFTQKGMFAISGNEVVGDKIKKSIIPLNSIKPTMVIRVPFEYKKAVKRELDAKYNINETTIYPELPSVAEYLKEKYKKVDYVLDGGYSILEVEDTSHSRAKRTSVVAVLNKDLSIEDVRRIGIKIIDEYKSKNDVVWLYIAKNGDDYILRNWMLRGQWIRESLNSKFKPHPIGKVDDSGYIWRFEKSYSTLADYSNEYVFEDDKVLFIQNMKTLKDFEPYYEDMISIFENGDMEKLTKYINEKADVITEFLQGFSDYGLSRNDKFNKYLSNFEEMAINLDNVVLWIKNEKLNLSAKQYQIANCFKEAKFRYNIIEQEAENWKRTINLSEAEYHKTDLREIKRREYQYTQTMPLNIHALEVTFSLDISRYKDNTVSIKGSTNLFDKAKLMVSIINTKGKSMVGNNSEVENGRFDFGRLGKKGIGLDKGKYKVRIFVPIPSVQSEEFVRKSGLEYENLKGKYVDRRGIGPTVMYTEEIEI